MMLAVLISALVVNWLRPVTRTKAEKRFLTVPGATRWVGRHEVHARSAGSMYEGDVWIVDFTESGNSSHRAQMIVSPKGKTHAIGLAPGKFN